jgi:hypothetical protein
MEVPQKIKYYSKKLLEIINKFRKVAEYKNHHIKPLYQKYTYTPMFIAVLYGTIQMLFSG